MGVVCVVFVICRCVYVWVLQCVCVCVCVCVVFIMCVFERGVAIKKPDCFYYSFPATSMTKRRVGH